SNCPTSLQKWIFKSATTSTKTTATSEPSRSSKTVATTQPPTSSNNVEQAKEVEVEELPSKPPTSANTPVQNRLKSEIADLTLKIKKLQDFVSTGFAKDDQKHELHQDRLKLKELTQKLNRAENLRKAEQKLREKKKLEAPQTLPKPKRGRPPIEKEQEGLQEAILNLVYYGASADDRRRSEILKCAKTINTKKRQYERRKKHVNTVPVKLIRPSNSLRKEYKDTHFCAGQIKHIRDLAELLGPQALNVLSVDDKARVPLGEYGRPVPRHFAKAPKRFLGSSQTMSKRLLLPVARLTKHGKIHKNLATIFELAEEEIETEAVSSIVEGGVQIIEDMEAWMQPIYEDDTAN
ncbi:hypothetical protein ILUMI_16127, partial [Ignelater luminosus]